jgi:hypothetical protein
MSMTEAEAKKKWCPFARTIQTRSGFHKEIVPVANRDENGRFEASSCLGSECAAWRWRPSPEEAEANKNTFSVTDTHIAEGFCGLAGKS